MSASIIPHLHFHLQAYTSRVYISNHLHLLNQLVKHRSYNFVTLFHFQQNGCQHTRIYLDCTCKLFLIRSNYASSRLPTCKPNLLMIYSTPTFFQHFHCPCRRQGTLHKRYSLFNQKKVYFRFFWSTFFRPFFCIDEKRWFLSDETSCRPTSQS